jgi:hypothetical protein
MWDTLHATIIFAARGTLAKAVFGGYFPLSQCIVEQCAEVGLDDVELARRHRDRRGKIIDDVWAGFRERRRPTTNYGRQPRLPTSLSARTANQT